MTHTNRVWRKSIGARLIDVAAIVVVSEALVQRWEVGKRQPSAEQAHAWRQALKSLQERSEARRSVAREL